MIVIHCFASRLSKWKKWAVLRLTQVGVELLLGVWAMPASFDFAQLHVKDEVIIAVDPPQHVLQSANVDSCHSSFISGSLVVRSAFNVLNDSNVFDHCFAFQLAAVVCLTNNTIVNQPPN